MKAPTNTATKAMSATAAAAAITPPKPTGARPNNVSQPGGAGANRSVKLTPKETTVLSQALEEARDGDDYLKRTNVARNKGEDGEIDDLHQSANEDEKDLILGRAAPNSNPEGDREASSDARIVASLKRKDRTSTVSPNSVSAEFEKHISDPEQRHSTLMLGTQATDRFETAHLISSSRESEMNDIFQGSLWQPSTNASRRMTGQMNMIAQRA